MFFCKVYSRLLKVSMLVSAPCPVCVKLQNNEHLAGALLVGILHIAMLSDVNNVRVRLLFIAARDVSIFLSRCSLWVRQRGTPQPACSREARLDHCMTVKMK